MKTPFTTGVIWNLGSFAILAASGFALNVLIGRYYGAAAFGVFTQVLACYYVFSQLAVGGLGYSTLSLVARPPYDAALVRPCLGAALALVTGLSLSVTAAAAALSIPIGSLLDSPGVTAGVVWSLPGLACFALNKVLLFALNGLGQMRAHAVFTSMRYLLIIAVAGVLVGTEAGAEVLPLALSAGEIILLPLIGVYAYRLGILAPFSFRRQHVQEHLPFAARSFLTPLVQDATSKVDVVILGMFAADEAVGVYAFAAMLALDGFYQLVYVVQINVSPLVSAIPPEVRGSRLQRLIRISSTRLVPAMAVLAALGAAVFIPITRILTGRPTFDAGWIYFAILAGAIAVSTAYLPFLTVLNQWGRPGVLFRLVAAQFVVNAILNLALIPFIGGTGAAIATGISYVVLAIALRWVLRSIG